MGKAKKMHVLITGGLFMLLFVASVQAASWYVDKDATGENNGTSWPNAWKSFENIVWGPNGVKGGDTLYISGGTGSKTYTATKNAMFAPAASGSLGAIIVIATGAKSPFPSGHDGMVIFDGTGAYSLISANYLRYVTFDGEKNGMINWRIENGKKDARNDPSLVDLPNGRGLIFRYIELKSGAQGINVTGGNADCTSTDVVEISNSLIHDIRDDFCIRAINMCMASPKYDGVLIHHNVINPNRLTFADGSGPDGVQATFGASVYNNYFEGKLGPLVYGPGQGQHSDHIQPMGKYFKVYNNVFKNWGNAAVEYETNDTDSGYFRMWNNVLALTDPAATGYSRAVELFWGSKVSTIKDFHIYNNTFVDIGGYYVITGGKKTGMTISNSGIVNNIFYNCGRRGAFELIHIAIGSSQCGEGLLISSNLINPGTSGSNIVTCNGQMYTPTNSETGTPGFLSYSPKAANNDFRISSSDTGARNKGIPLTSYFTTDILGKPRPDNSAWTIGAYEGSTNGPFPPINLRVITP